MSYGCPICNGLQLLIAECPQCNQAMMDGGRAEDYLGPYSPYQPDEEWQNTHIDASGARSTCVHYLMCESCGLTATSYVDEQLL